MQGSVLSWQLTFPQVGFSPTGYYEFCLTHSFSHSKNFFKILYLSARCFALYMLLSPVLQGVLAGIMVLGLRFSFLIHIQAKVANQKIGCKPITKEESAYCL
jgi:hypothetical protein